MARRLLVLFLITLTILICRINSHGHGHSHDHGHGHGHAHDHGHGHGHGHDHGHGHFHEEPPSFKYSREANEAHHGHDHDHGHGHAHSDEEKYSPPHYNEGSDDDEGDEEVPFSVMSWALLSTLGISIAPVIILLFIPVTNSPQHQWILKILLSFASGGLLGDAFLHLIPHAMSSHGSDEKGHGHSHSHSHGESHDHSADIHIGLNILLGIFLFLLVEKFVRHVKGGEHSHGHSHNVVEKQHVSDAEEDDNDKKKKSPKKTKPKTAAAAVAVPASEIKISGYLNLFADFLHNFTDGLAIGSTYLLGRKVGAITTMTIFFHEIPHEIGDYAILIQNGCSRKKAMFLQLTTAIGALLGCLVGLLFHSIGTQLWATQTFLPITAGGFIYIATVSVIPELLETNGGLKQSILEMLALIVGVLIMVAVAIYE